MKKKTEQKLQQPATAPQIQPGAGMLRLLSQAEMKQVGGGRSGPSPRGPGH